MPRVWRWMVRRHDYPLVVIAVMGLTIGLALAWAGYQPQARAVWTVSTVPVLLALVVQIVVSLRRGDVGLDVVAALSMSAALAFGESLAGNVVALMYSGGQLLENFAQRRAHREMTALLGRVAHTVMCYRDGALEDVPIQAVVPGDRLLIRNGEVVPVDGHVASGLASLDLSALTGESMPEQVRKGGEALSGAASVGEAFDLIASRPASESTYAGIVRLVETAQTSKAPMVRLADRYAIVFLVLTLAIAGAAWLISQDHIRLLAVLVVATPCPLILAVPVAIISGMSRAAHMGVLVKDGGALEALASVRTAMIDKTGTLTHGEAAVTEIKTTGGFTESDVLRLAASLDRASGHVVAGALIKEAVARGLPLSPPTQVKETPGTGIEGCVDGTPVIVGSDRFVRSHSAGLDPYSLHVGLSSRAMTVAVAIGGHLAGVIVLQDRIRGDAKSVVADLRSAGVDRIVLASGDRSDIADRVGRELGVDAVLGDLTPEGKLAAVRKEAASAPVMMVGDGVNDAPALAAADVGVALGARGAAASSEAAGIVLLVDKLAPLAKAVNVARRSRTIALQSVVVGLGLSVGAMIVAAFGYLTPVHGALLQEAIDIAVIFNALRALK